MDEIDEIIKIITQLNKYLQDCYVLGGSWVLYFYRFKYPDFKYPLRTFDIDFIFSLYAKRKKIKVDLQKILENLGYYPEVIGTVTGYSYSRFKGENIDLEFIIEEPTGNKNKILKLNNLNIDAIPLPFVGDLLEDIIFAEVENVKIPLPSPERFHIHKWLVVQRRKDLMKKEKDLQQGLEILKICNLEKLNQLIQELKGKRKKLYEKSKQEIENL
ncbi:GSU2403 family nucleotidyltransferase fold protein [Hydrogenothermus marinus]|uniref:Nucleotidyltransferase-like protein n=1 Tax=Hydrogenothermus marinus TaxID=133270 RepID=A0A3M0BU96_9AQUI|nr:GSU2403 family nucleotidyltransferase fold protein [Hydrogenothermus marinus]RMB00055.1 nucleotidyltransferase-like protein [Hydrogenothermus marinus]